jgi:hypothetical protein
LGTSQKGTADPALTPFRRIHHVELIATDETERFLVSLGSPTQMEMMNLVFTSAESGPG